MGAQPFQQKPSRGARICGPPLLCVGGRSELGAVDVGAISALTPEMWGRQGGGADERWPRGRLPFPLWYPTQRHPAASTVTYRTSDIS